MAEDGQPVAGPAGAQDAPSRAELEAWDDRHVWHPFTPHSVYRQEEPLLIERGEGHYLIDVDGNRYLDAVSSIWCNALGHRHPRLDRALREQLDLIAHATFLGNATVPAIKLARRLVELAPPGLSRVFYSDDGSTAVEIALKMAYQFWQQNGRPERTRFLALHNGYNGDTVGAVSVGGVDLFHERFRGLLFDAIRAPSPYCYRCPRGGEAHRCGGDEGCMGEVYRLVARHAEELAAVVVEPGMQGAGGMIPQPPGFLKRLEAVCREHDVLLIFDEVAMGMGRSGAMFAAETEGVRPDLLCLAKMLTGGYVPLAATLTTERIYEGFLGRFEEFRTFFHGHTFTGNPLGAAVALAVLDALEHDGVLEALPQKIERLQEALSRLEALPWVGQVRQYGLAAGVELVQDRQTKEPFAASSRCAYRICRAARDRGVFFRPLSANLLVLMPPLTIEDGEIEQMVDALHHGITAVLGQGPEG